MYLHALGHFHPPTVITNAFLATLDIGTDETWISERVGIRTRHTVLSLDYIRNTKNADVREASAATSFSNAQTAVKAAEVAFSRAKITNKDIGMVIAGGCSPDECIPAESCRIAEALNIDAPALDIASACSSFCAQLHLLDSMRPERLPDFVLVVNSENNTRVVDYRDRTSCVLWGDGTSAAIVSPRIRGPYRIVETLLRGDPSGADKVKIPRLGHFTQQGAAVQSFAVRRASELYDALADSWVKSGEGRMRKDVAFIGHQANLRMLDAVVRRSEVDAANHFFNVDIRGNTGAAGAPSVLSENWGNSKLPDAIAVCVVGSGLTWSGALLEKQAL